MSEYVNLLQDARGMEKCPAEVLHLICRLLIPKDIKEARLVCKMLAVIAGQYLVPVVTFNSSAVSLDRLKMISQHPLFSQHVNKLIYEANILPPVHNIRCYEKILISKRMHTIDHPDPPPRNSSRRAYRVFMRAMTKFTNDCGLTKKQLETQFNKYKTMREAQQLLLESKYDKNVLINALPRFPRLKSIKFDNLGRCKHVLSERHCEQFQEIDGFPTPGDPTNIRVVPQVAHLLKAMCKTKAAIENFDLAAVNPNVFKNLTSASRELVNRNLNKLKTIKLAFKVDGDTDDMLDELEPDDSFEVFEDDSLKTFLASNQELEDLQVSFLDCPMHVAVKIENLLGDHHWINLRSICLMSIKTSSDDLLACLRRHSSSLIDMRLGYVVLTEGEWDDTIDGIQLIFCDEPLMAAKFWGYLLTNDPTESIDLSYVDPDWDGFDEDYDGEPTTLAQAIECYICDENPEEDLSINPLHRLEEFIDPLEYDLEPVGDYPIPGAHYFH